MQDKTFNKLMKAFLQERWILINKTGDVKGDGKDITKVLLNAMSQMKDPKLMYYYSYDHMQPSKRAAFMNEIKESRQQESNFVLFVRGLNMGFASFYTAESVIAAIKASVKDLTTPFTDIKSMLNAMNENIDSACKCCGCLKSTINGSTCCDHCNKAICTDCLAPHCPECGEIRSLKVITKHCSGQPLCKRTTMKKRCGFCKVVFYCSELCRESHWETHKQECLGKNTKV